MLGDETKVANMTEEQVKKICEDNGTTEQNIWDSFVDYRIEFRKSEGSKLALDKAIETVAEELSLERRGAEHLYFYLYKKFIG